MIDHVLAIGATRSRYLTIAIATTGTMELAATASGYTRLAGDFRTEGFYPGMEITPAGFGANAVDIITRVEALALTTKTAHAVEASAAARSIIAYIPAGRAFDNDEFDPSAYAGRPFVSDQWSPDGHFATTFPVDQGRVTETGIYFLTWFGLHGYGSGAIRKSVGAVLARFTPGTLITMSDGNTLQVRGLARNDPGPRAGQIIRVDGGRAYCQAQIPWLARTQNSIAA